MRNKILQLIYDRLATPTINSTFSQASPFDNHWGGAMAQIQIKVMDFTLNFTDGQPCIRVRTRRTDTPWFMYRLGYGTKFVTSVSCHPLEFQLSQLEHDALEAAVKQHHQRHLQLKYDAEYLNMEKKINIRLGEHE